MQFVPRSGIRVLNQWKTCLLTRGLSSVASEQVQNGTDISLDPRKHEDYFSVKDMVTVKDLFDAKVHIGQNEILRNPYMSHYIYGNRLGVDIINLDETLPLLHRALNFTAHIAYSGGIILFLSHNQEMLPLVEQTAIDCGEYAHCRRWIDGIFTNSAAQFGTITRLPDLCIFLSTLTTTYEPHMAMRDGAKMNIPSVGILDTDCDPRLITYPVPGNDDASHPLKLYCTLFKQVIMKAKQVRQKHMTDGSR